MHEGEDIHFDVDDVACRCKGGCRSSRLHSQAMSRRVLRRSPRCGALSGAALRSADCGLREFCVTRPLPALGGCSL